MTQLLFMPSLPTHSTENSATANLNLAIYGFLFQNLLFMCPLTNYKSRDCRQIHKNTFWKKNLVIVPHRGMFWYVQVWSKAHILLFQVGREGRKRLQSLSPKIFQEWTLAFLSLNKTIKSLKAIRQSYTLLILLSQHIFVLIFQHIRHFYNVIFRSKEY